VTKLWDATLSSDDRRSGDTRLTLRDGAKCEAQKVSTTLGKIRDGLIESAIERRSALRRPADGRCEAGFGGLSERAITDMVTHHPRAPSVDAA
jgi:hypothetical protein